MLKWFRLVMDAVSLVQAPRLCDIQPRSYASGSFWWSIAYAIQRVSCCCPWICSIMQLWIYFVDDLYTYIHIRAGQLCLWAEAYCILIVGTVEGCGYDGQLFVMLVGHATLYSKHIQDSFSLNSIVLLYLQVYLYVEIFLLIITMTTSESIPFKYPLCMHAE